MCDKITTCISLEHNKNGDCLLLSSRDFSVSCSPSDPNPNEDASKLLYIGYKEVVDEDRPKYNYKELGKCFVLAGMDGVNEIKNVEDCKDLCSDAGDFCYIVQYDSEEKTCYTLSPSDGIRKESPCSNSGVTFLRSLTNPYRTMENTCLRNRLELDGNRIYNTEDYECLALCNAHPRCRYFLYGKDAKSTAESTGIRPRECLLFESQREALDECEDQESSYPYFGLTAQVNGRTFEDQITWFGEPKLTIATLPGLSYQECASICDDLEDLCNAFVHTWNYRRNSDAARPVIFSKTRLIRVNFGDDRGALYLQFDLENEQLIVAPSFTDDDVKRQSIFFETVTDDTDNVVRFKLKFWSATDKCVAAEGTPASLPASKSPGGATLDIIQDNFGLGITPSCQKLVVADCDDALVFQTTPEEGFLAIEYVKNGVSGCMRVRPNVAGGTDYVAVEPRNETGSLDIPPTFNSSSVLTFPTCIRTRERRFVQVAETAAPTSSPTDKARRQLQSNPDEFATPFDYRVITDCPVGHGLVEAELCTETEWTEVEDTKFFTDEKTTSCQMPPVPVDCMSVNKTETEATTVRQEIEGKVVPPGSTIITETETCDWRSDINATTERRTQKTAFDLLEEMFEFYASEEGCGSTTTDYNLRVYSSSYSDGCGFDPDVISIPSQRFAYASEPVLLSNDISSSTDSSRSCLTSSLSLGFCDPKDKIGAVEWTYVFRQEAQNAGQLFYVDEEAMKCLTREEIPTATPSATPTATPSVSRPPSTTPSVTSSKTPSTTPSSAPSEMTDTMSTDASPSTPSATPSSETTGAPSAMPSTTPSAMPTATPSATPSVTSPSFTLKVADCNSDDVLQRWDYDALNGYLKVVDSEAECLIYSGSLEIRNCAMPEA
eukprot:scaffold29923_cov71-Attheya_sp.AAC.1